MLLAFFDDNFDYQVFNLDTNRLVISHNVSFREDVFPFHTLTPAPVTLQEEALMDSPSRPLMTPPLPVPPVSDDDGLLSSQHPVTDPPTPPPPAPTEIAMDGLTPTPPTPTILEPPRRSERARTQTNRYTPGSHSVVLYDHRAALLSQAQTLQHTFWVNSAAFIDDSDQHNTYAFASTPTARLLDEPRTFAQAMSSPNALHWKAACDKELAVFKQKGVWHLVRRPVNRNVIKGRWVFKIKLKEDGGISK